MKFTKLIAGLLLLAIVGAAGWWLGQRQQDKKIPVSSSSSGAAATDDRKVLYWYDPMKPEVRFDQPGKSPFMDMPLQPKYAGSGGSASDTVSVDPRMAQNLGLRVAPVQRGDFALRIDTVGTVAVNQNRIRALTARAQGYLERLDVHAVGDPLRRGQSFGAVYAPQLLATQDELLLAQRSGDSVLRAAARQRLLLLGVSPAMIDAVIRNGRAQRDVAVVSPVDGVLTQLNVRQGDPVSPGMALAQVADLSQVWIEVQVPEAQSGWIASGNPAVVTLPALPGKVFDARVDYVYPDLQASTRSLRLRLVLDNPELALKPGMYAQISLRGAAQRGVLTVPDEAVLHDGDRSLVMLATGDGRYLPRPVRLGADDGRRSVVFDGLHEGDKIVVSGQFLIDAEANLTGALQRLQPGNADGEVGGGMQDMPDMAAPARSSEMQPGTKP
ncbi:MAG: efflux RND transporter periplasmic adaptor subunit [Stenotrophobium sp.]